MARKITHKQRKFADSYLQHGNGTQAVLAVYDTTDPAVAAPMASENLSKPNVRQYLEDRAHVAASIVFQLANHGESDNIKLAASKDILDRAGFNGVTETRSLNVSMTAKDLQDAVTKDMKRFNGPTKPSSE